MWKKDESRCINSDRDHACFSDDSARSTRCKSLCCLLFPYFSLSLVLVRVARPIVRRSTQHAHTNVEAVGHVWTDGITSRIASPTTTGASAAVGKSNSDTSDIHSDRLIIVCTMSYQHIFQRPNLARTAAQLQQAGPRVLWVVIEDTHSLRKMASTPEHYAWIINSTRAFVASLGIDAVYIADESPFPRNAPRSPKIETHQRNLGLEYVESLSLMSSLGGAVTTCNDPHL